MTFSWYAHLKNLSNKPWWIAALLSWGIAFFEYALQVPANRIGFEHFNLAQLKITQEVITLAVFVPFSIFLYGATVQVRFYLGWFMFVRRCVFHI